MANDLQLKVTLRGDGKHLSGTLRDASGEVREFGSMTDRAGRQSTSAFDQTGRSVRGVNREVTELSRASDLARHALLALGGALSVREVIGYSDAWTNTTNQLRTVTNSNQQLMASQQRLMDLANGTRTAYESTANLYARLARATTELNLGQERTYRLVETINKSFSVSGATAQEAAAAITQLSQGLAAGALRGDEFNSVSEQAPAIMRAIADSLDMTIGELREFAASGGITADIVVNALERASDTIDQTFGESVASFGQKMALSRNNMLEFVGTSTVLNDAVSGTGDAILGVTEALSSNAGAVNVAIGAIGGAATAYGTLTAATWAAQAAQVAFNRVVKLNPYVALATGAASLIGALYSVRNVTAEINGETVRLGDLAEPVMRDFANGAITVTNTLAQHLGPGVENIVDRIRDIDFNTVVTQTASAIDEAIRLWGGFTEALSTAWDKFVITLGPRMVEQLNPVLQKMSDLANWKPPWLEGVLPDWGFDFTIDMPDAEGVANAGRTLGEAFMSGYNMTAAFGPSATEYVNTLVGDASTNRQLREFQSIVDSIFNPTGDGVAQIKDLGDGVRDLGDASSEAGKAAKAQADALQTLLDKLDPVAKSQRDFQTDTQLLNQAVSQGTITFDRYFELVDKLQLAYQSAGNAAQEYGFDGQRAAKDVQEAFNPALTAMQRGVERLDDTFVDFWENLLSGSKNTFESFKDVAISTLAEIIHAYTTRQITAQLGLAIRGDTASGSRSGTGTGSSSLSDLGSKALSLYNGGGQIAGNAWRAFQGTGSTYAGTFGSELVANSNGGFVSGLNSVANSGMFANAALGIGGGLVGSYAGTQLGSSLFGKQANSNYGAMVGTALGQAFIPIPGVGALVGGAIGGLLDSAFGSSRDPKFKAWQGAMGSNGDNEYRPGYHADSEFGTLTVLDKVMHEPEDILNALGTVTQVDNTFASVMTDAQKSSVVSDFSTGWKLNEKSIGGVLNERYERMFDVLDKQAVDGVEQVLLDRVPELSGDNLSEWTTELGNALQLNKLIEGLSGNVRDYAERVVTESNDSIESLLMQVQSSVNNLQLMANAAEQLNLSFDSAADGAVEAANAIAEAAGGYDQLAQAQQQYYQLFYTDQERFTRNVKDLRDRLGDAGVELPTSVDAMRDLVESLELTTDAGQRSYAALVNNSQAISDYIKGLDDQRAALREQQQMQASIDLYSSGALGSITSALDSYNGALATASDIAETRRKQLEDEQQAITSLSDLLSSLNGSDLSPGSSFDAARRQYDALYARVQTGDTNAVSDLTGAARDYLGLAQDTATSALAYARQQGQVALGVAGLRDQFEDSVDELGDSNDIGELQLREQQRIEETLVDQLAAQIGIVDGINTWSDLLASLPANIASEISGIVASGNGSRRAGNTTLPDGIYTGTEGFDTADSAINDIYNEYLGRNADAEGLDYYKDELAKGNSLSDIEARIANDAAHGAFATGGAFTNGVVHRPTYFDMGLMGEAGAEAIVPLANVGGALGINAAGLVDASAIADLVVDRLPALEPQSLPTVVMPPPMLQSAGRGDRVGSDDALVRELKRLREQVSNMESRLQAINKATAEMNGRGKRWDYDGLPETRNVALEATR